MKVLRRIMIGVWIAVLLAFGALNVADYTNDRMIENYNHGKYEQNSFGFLGFLEPFVNHYNRGNICFKLGDYESAEAEYRQALEYDLDEPTDCRTRVNLALSLVKPLDIDHIDEENQDEIIAVLEEARAILMENGCADDDNTGHNPEAQTLKNEIDALIDSILNPPQEEPSPTPTPCVKA